MAFEFLNRLRRQRPPVPDNVRVPSDTRVYAIGDIHGRVDLLDALHDKILVDAKKARMPRNVVVYLGDYVDRGLDSRAVLARLIDSPLSMFERVYLKGNHEAILLDFLEDSSIGPKWLAIGGNSTLFSYSVELSSARPSLDEFEVIQTELKRKLPQEHLTFLRTLGIRHVEGDYQFVHAGVRPGQPLDLQAEQDLIWIREPFLGSRIWHGKMIVHGHSTERQPQVMENRIGIDTAAYASGTLTSLVLWDEECEFLFAKN